MGDVATFLESGGDNWKGMNGTMVKRVRCDFSVTNVSAADVVKLFTMKAGILVHNVISKVVTAEGGAATGDIGDTTDPNGFNDAVDLNGTALDLEQGLVATDAYVTGHGKLYSGAETIDLVPDHNLDAAVMDFYLIYTDITAVD